MNVPRRRTAEERRSELVDAALAEFAAHGLDATTEAIARLAGVSQPYVFRLFPSKTALLQAALERCFDIFSLAFADALGADAPAEPIARIERLGAAYVALLPDRTILLALLQAFAAGRDDELREVVRRRYRALMELVREMTRAHPALVDMFFAHGALISIATAVGLDEIPIRPLWADHPPIFPEEDRK